MYNHQINLQECPKFSNFENDASQLEDVHVNYSP
jgi:hypothetical protein